MDSEDPVLAGVPADETTTCGLIPDINDVNVTATDNCSTDLEVVVDEQIINDGCGVTIIRTWTVEDACGNQATATQTITSTDDDDPVFVTSPADLTINCGETVTITAADFEAEDNCDSDVAIALDNVETIEGNCAGNAMQVYTFIATDDCGNTATATVTIMTIDDLPPTLVGVPTDDITMGCSEIPELPNVTATDNCDNEVEVELVETTENTDCGMIITRTWTATDACGNPATATQVVTLGDTEEPVLGNLPDDITVECDNIPTAADVTVTDDCDTDINVMLNDVITPGACNQAYIITRTFTAMDDCGNEVSFVQIVTVEDNTAPVFNETLPEDVDFACGQGNIPTAAILTATDSCDPTITVDYNEDIQSNDCGLIYVRTWTATDDCGNTTTHIQTLNATDATAPSLAFNNPMLDGLSNGESVDVNCTMLPGFGADDVIAIDNCDTAPEVTYSESIIGEGACPLLVIESTWTVVDGCGNEASLVILQNVVDTEAPVVNTSPADITVTCDLPEAGSIDVTDNCDEVLVIEYTDEQTSNGCPYEVTRTWTIVDGCGNTATTSQLITVIDEIDPALVGVPADLTVNTNIGEIVPDAPTVTATDNCDTDVFVEMTEASEPTGTGCGEIITRTWTATDDCGNAVSASQVITILGELSITLTPDAVEVCAGETIEFNVTPNGATYNWSATSGSFSDATAQNPVYTNTASGTYTITVEVEAGGCVGTATAQVTINDSADITATNNGPLCIGATLELTATAGATSYQWTGPNFFSQEQNPTIENIDVTNAGEYTVTVQFESGCTGTATTTVEIDEELPVTIFAEPTVCEGDSLIVYVNNGSPDFDYSWTGPNNFTSTDQNAVVFPAVYAVHGGLYTVVVTSPDGCTATLSASIEVIRKPTPNIGSNAPVCVGGDLELMSDGGIEYVWTGPNGWKLS